MRFLAFLLFSFWSPSIIAQTSSLIELSWTETSIHSPDGTSVKTLYFSGASLEEKNQWLPKFSYLAKTGSAGDVFSAELLDTEFELLSSVETEILRNKSVTNKIIPAIQSLTIRKQIFQQVHFLPIRKNAATGQLEKLVRFRLRLKKQKQLKNNIQLTKNYTKNSVLSSGKWIKIAVDTTAIHKISYTQLLEMGITNPAKIRIHGYGGGMLSQMNNAPTIDDLPPVPVYLHTGSDGIFNAGDFLLFYAKGPQEWQYDEENKEFIHNKHLYSDQSFYFLSSDAGNPNFVQTAPQQTQFNSTVTSFDDYRVVDNNKENLLESGQLWLGEKFDVTTNYPFSFHFPKLDRSEPISISVQAVGRSSSPTKFELFSNSSTIGEIKIASVNTGSYTSNYASIEKKRFTSFTPDNDQFSIRINYQKSSASSAGWLDYIRINARRNLIFTGSQMAFRDTRSVQAGNFVKFQLQNTSTNTMIWDVSQAESIKIIPVVRSENTVEFIVSSSVLKEFVAFDPNGNFPEPQKIGIVQNQNLHALPQSDLLIICPKKFMEYAGKIADFHKTNDNLSVVIADPEQIYNEFSSGNRDAGAIRNFVKMFYDRATNEPDMPKYLLLFGDGSFDNKSQNENNTNQLPTYQSENSLSPTQSFSSDDFFGLLDDDEGKASGMVDIGIGRLPVNTAEEAQIVTSKILNYHKSEYGDWRTLVSFIADDEDNNTHMKDANQLALHVENNFPRYNTKRIFLDNYEQVTSSAGQRYPDVNKQINETINNGTLILNYTGHGNETGLALEKIVTTDDILNWENSQKLTLFMTATCEFSRFDNYKKQSAGEIVFLRDNGGGIGLFTTTRLVFSSPNFSLNQNFYKYVLNRDDQGNYYRLGDIMRKTKNATASGINKRNFTLLGDPALRLAYPKQKAVSLKVNNVDISQPVDTLKALSKVNISGAIVTDTGEEANNFSGIVYPTVFDKATIKTTRGNDGNPFEYKEQTNVLYKGKASVTNGKFSFNFFVPKDINYRYGKGKISYYAKASNLDAAGYTNSIVIGGTNPDAQNDKIGPEIELYMNDEQFISGGTTGQNPLLLAIVQDASGINTIGNSIGHNIIATLDQNISQPIELNNYYEADLDSYQKGKITYRLTDLETGEHEIQLKLWDNVNNSSESSLDFIVAESVDLVLTHVLNYPNPFSTNTGFYFEHNQTSKELDVLIQILTISGKLIKTIDQTVSTNGRRIGPIAWDGKDDFGNNIGRGAYIYRIKVRTEDGKVANKFQKLVILK